MADPVRPLVGLPPQRRQLVAAGLLWMVLELAGCAAGPEALAPQDDIVQPVAAAAEPGTVSRKPLLPPVPTPPAAQPGSTGDGWSASAPPLQYDRLYSDEEQAKIQTDLLNAAARAKVN